MVGEHIDAFAIRTARTNTVTRRTIGCRKQWQSLAPRLVGAASELGRRLCTELFTRRGKKYFVAPSPAWAESERVGAQARVARPRDAVIGETDRRLFGPGPARDQLPRRPDEVAPRPLCEVACAPTRLQAVLAPASWNTIGLVRA
jgi:hypothetical protein